METAPIAIAKLITWPIVCCRSLKTPPVVEEYLSYKSNVLTLVARGKENCGT